ncbi:MAG TPA: phosphotransferase, partial [Myxococcota bacterium]|nr:phosphotransferase [Myxococcota bacterium]
MSPAPDSRALSVLEAKAPDLSAAQAEAFAQRHFGVRGSARALPSERDQNFHLRGADGREFVLKIANPAEDPSVLDFQSKALLHIASVDPELPVPHLVTTTDGAESCEIEAADGRRSIVRLLSYLRGGVLADARRSRELLRDVGASAARLGQALRGFFHPASRQDLLWDLTQAPSLLKRTHAIEDPEARRLVERVLEHLASAVMPELARMRAQVIHNDVSCMNTLVDADRVVGVIDFGDMVHAPLVCDLVVPIAELMVDVDDPFGVAMQVAAGYCAVERLSEQEIAVLYDLVAARMSMAVAIAAWRVAEHPENRAYITAGIEGNIKALLWLADRKSDFFRACMRSAGGFAASPSAPALARWLGEQAREAGAIFERDLARLRKRVLADDVPDAAALGAAVDVAIHPYGARACRAAASAAA